MTTEDDVILIERLKNRDAQAMVLLYDRFKRLVFSITFHCVRDNSIAEDLTQETFWRVWNRIHSFDVAKGSLEPWIATIARNRAVDHLRSSRNAPQYSLDSIEANARFFSTPGSAEQTDRKRLISRALQSLNPSQREVIELTHFQGLTQSEIARFLKRPLGSIKTTIRGALKVLREALQEERA
jgi:RNA polymerase sigma-70 factor, ECF subfamily